MGLHLDTYSLVPFYLHGQIWMEEEGPEISETVQLRGEVSSDHTHARGRCVVGLLGGRCV